MKKKARFTYCSHCSNKVMAFYSHEVTDGEIYSTSKCPLKKVKCEFKYMSNSSSENKSNTSANHKSEEKRSNTKKSWIKGSRSELRNYLTWQGILKSLDELKDLLAKPKQKKIPPNKKTDSNFTKIDYDDRLDPGHWGDDLENIVEYGQTAYNLSVYATVEGSDFRMEEFKEQLSLGETLKLEEFLVEYDLEIDGNFPDLLKSDFSLSDLINDWLPQV